MGKIDSVHLLSDGTFKLDGGAMHGVVPKSLWEKFNPPDEKNRILLGVNALLVQAGSDKILIEPGIGSGHPEKFVSLYAVEKKRTLVDELKSIGVRPEEIHLVIPTHLHFDHAGGVADWRTGALFFPNARHVIQKSEWEAAMDPHPKNQASYLPEFMEPLKKARVELVDGEKEIYPGIRVKHTGGHTHGHQAVFIEWNGTTVAFLGDLAPTTAHLNPLWVMAYDVDPEASIRAKQSLIAAAEKEKWEMILVHDVFKPAGKVVMEKGRYAFAPSYHSTAVGAPLSLQSVQS